MLFLHVLFQQPQVQGGSWLPAALQRPDPLGGGEARTSCGSLGPIHPGKGAGMIQNTEASLPPSFPERPSRWADTVLAAGVSPGLPCGDTGCLCPHHFVPHSGLGPCPEPCNAAQCRARAHPHPARPKLPLLRAGRVLQGPQPMRPAASQLEGPGGCSGLGRLPDVQPLPSLCHTALEPGSLLTRGCY